MPVDETPFVNADFHNPGQRNNLSNTEEADQVVVVPPSSPPPNLPDAQKPDYVPPSRESLALALFLKIFLIGNWWARCAADLWWLCFITCLITFIWLLFAGYQYGNLIIFIISLVGIIFSTVHYILQVLGQSSGKFLRGQRPTTTDVYQLVDRLKKQAPRLWMEVDCYHYEKKHRTKFYTDAQGKSQMRKEEYHSHVSSFSEKVYFPYAQWTDASGEFRVEPGLLPKRFIKMSLQKEIIFNDQETADVYKRYGQQLRDAHRHRDEFIDFSQGIELDGFEEEILGTVGEKDPSWVNFKVYVILGIFCLPGLFQIPFLALFDSICGKQQFTVFKRVSLHPSAHASQSTQHDSVLDINDVKYHYEEPQSQV